MKYIELTFGTQLLNCKPQRISFILLFLRFNVSQSIVGEMTKRDNEI